MERAAKPAKAKVEARLPVARKSRKTDGSTGRQLEQRLADALEQQAATSEILRVISSSRTDAQPVFDTIAANALRLCDARFSAVFRFDGERIHIAAFQNLTPEGTAAFLTAYPCLHCWCGTTQRAIPWTRSIVHMPDIRVRIPSNAYQDVAQESGLPQRASPPCRCCADGEVIGTITVKTPSQEARPFPDAQVELLKTFADQAVIAVENVRLFTELQARNQDLTIALDQQTATSEILQVISASPSDVQPVLNAVAKRAARLCEAPLARLLLVDGDVLRAMAEYSLDGTSQARTVPLPLKRTSIIGRAVLDRATIHHDDVVPLLDSEYPDALNARRLGLVPCSQCR